VAFCFAGESASRRLGLWRTLSSHLDGEDVRYFCRFLLNHSSRWRCVNQRATHDQRARERHQAIIKMGESHKFTHRHARGQIFSDKMRRSKADQTTHKTKKQNKKESD